MRRAREEREKTGNSVKVAISRALTANQSARSHTLNLEETNNSKDR